MKALVKKQPGEGLWLEEMPQPGVAANDVLIKVDRTGICGTDLHIYKWDDWAIRFEYSGCFSLFRLFRSPKGGL